MRQIGTRIHVIGNSASGKSTLAARLADTLRAPLVELDAINWQPEWVGLNTTDPDEFERRIREATRGERWVVAGSYRKFSQRTFWSRLDTVVWLDLPLRVVVWRFLRRTWKRWRSRQLIWGTNHERFWPQFRIWAEGRFTARVDHHPTPPETEGPGQGHVSDGAGPTSGLCGSRRRAKWRSSADQSGGRFHEFPAGA